MKKIIIIIITFILFNGPSFANEDTHINYYAYVLPGILTNSYYQFEHESLLKIRDIINEKLGIRLNIIYQKKLDKLDQTEEAFLKKLDNAVYGAEKIDLLYIPGGEEKIKELISRDMLMETDDLIRDHAPYLYTMYPKKFWQYRKQTGDVYSIPVRYYPGLTDVGFWTHRHGQLLEDQFLDQLMSSNIREAVIPFMTKRSVSEMLFSLMGSKGFVPVGYGEINMKLNDGSLLPLIETDARLLQILYEYQIWLSNLKKRTPLERYNKLTGFQWDYLYLPLSENVFNIKSAASVVKVLELFEHSQNNYLTEFYYDPFGYYHKLYIPTECENPDKVIAMIDQFMKDPFWYNIFVNGNESQESHRGEYEIDKNKTIYSLNNTGIKNLLMPFRNEIFHRINSYYPKKIRNEYIRIKKIYMTGNHPLNAFDIVSEYENAKEEMISSTDIFYYQDNRLLEGYLSSYINHPDSPSMKNWIAETLLLIKTLQNRMDTYLGM
jgi:hypothetical protein